MHFPLPLLGHGRIQRSVDMPEGTAPRRPPLRSCLWRERRGGAAFPSPAGHPPSAPSAFFRLAAGKGNLTPDAARLPCQEPFAGGACRGAGGLSSSSSSSFSSLLLPCCRTEPGRPAGGSPVAGSLSPRTGPPLSKIRRSRPEGSGFPVVSSRRKASGQGVGASPRPVEAPSPEARHGGCGFPFFRHPSYGDP